jgi:hypothetical protein
MGSWTMDGSVELSFSESTCSMSLLNDSVTRVANFTITGPRGATLTVSADGGGQRLTRNGSGFNFLYAVNGMERSAEDGKGKKLFDIATKTTSDISVTGENRRNRVMNGGVLEVTHKLAQYTTTLTPNNVTWNETCNCAVSGSFTGTASGSISGPYTLEITGCGTAKLTFNGKTQSIDFDRCGKL